MRIFALYVKDYFPPFFVQNFLLLFGKNYTILYKHLPV